MADLVVCNCWSCRYQLPRLEARIAELERTLACTVGLIDHAERIILGSGLGVTWVGTYWRGEIASVLDG
ncbi:MAG TPA: hypothetical protein VFY10_11620 [Dehalococcoidia bacterium]|nr:hypothetical protein [Dehalococcoidia bacterium]